MNATKSNFDYFDSVSALVPMAERAKKLEGYYRDGDAETAVSNCRKVLEQIVNWVYDTDLELKRPFDRSLAVLMEDDLFRGIFKKEVLLRMDTVRKFGNMATHDFNRISKEHAEYCIESIFVIMDFVAYIYFEAYQQRRFDRNLFLHPSTQTDASDTSTKKPDSSSVSRNNTTLTPYPDPEKQDNRVSSDLSSDLVNTLLGEKVCDEWTSPSEKEELLRYLAEGDISLTPEQQECVNFSGKSDLLIKGTAGSGKSIVLMQRAIKLRKQSIKDRSNSDVIILTYTNALVNSLKRTVASAVKDNSHIRVKTLDSFVGTVSAHIFGNQTAIDYRGNAKEKRIEYVEKAVQFFMNSHEDNRIVQLSPSFLDDEFQWIKGNDIDTLDEYRKSGRSGRGGSVRMSDADYAITFDLYKTYNQMLFQSGQCDRLDLYSQIVHNYERIPERDRVDFILVDEAQDLQPVILEFVKLLSKKSITVAADSAQKIYSGPFSLRKLGLDIRGRASKSLSSTFRNTKEISRLAESLYRVIKEKDSSDLNLEFTDPSTTARKGRMPIVIQCQSIEQEKDIIIKTIQKHLERDSETIGILYRSNSERDVICEWLYNARIPYQNIKNLREGEPYRERLLLCTMHSAKGLEFDTVIVPCFNSNIMPSVASLTVSDPDELATAINTERKLAYVSFTRPRKELYISFHGEPSPFFAELDRKTYRLFKIADGKWCEEPVPLQDAVEDKDVASHSQVIESRSSLDTDKKYNIGTKVSHSVFGKGRILRYTGSGKTTRVMVEFDKLAEPKSFDFPKAFSDSTLRRIK